MTKQRLLSVYQALSERISTVQAPDPYYRQTYTRTICVNGYVYVVAVHHCFQPLEYRESMIIPPMSYWSVRYGTDGTKEEFIEIGKEVAQCQYFEQAVAIADDLYQQVLEQCHVTRPVNPIFIRPRREQLAKKIVTYQLV